MEITKEVKNLLQIVNNRVNSQAVVHTNKVSLPNKDLSISELIALLNVYAKEYNTTLPAVIRKLDRVSGDVKALDKVYANKDEKVEWTPEEDKLLNTNENLLVRWKGEDSVLLRKRYLKAK